VYLIRYQIANAVLVGERVELEQLGLTIVLLERTRRPFQCLTRDRATAAVRRSIGFEWDIDPQAH